MSGGREDDAFEVEIDRSETPAPILVPLAELTPDTLTALIESFCRSSAESAGQPS